jgi:carbamoyl-phosphate synthase large subunit
MSGRKVLVLGSGPIVIGQAAEFDYAGTQACRALREEGIETVLVNSNPATIMTDPGVADRTYIEPLDLEHVSLVIARERPAGLLAGLGGQTALNLAVELADAGVLAKYGVEMYGTPIAGIKAAEDRDLFKRLLGSIGEPVAESVVARSSDDAEAFAATAGYPLIVRPAYTLGGTGGGTARTLAELRDVVASGLQASPVGQVLVERSLLGWKEIEYEVIRDAADTAVIVCNMENFDPMGVHTGDSIVVAPSQTLSDREYQMLRSASLRIVRALGVVGGCNVQFALDPVSSRYFVIEVNPRVSRSSALASKATGYPIARVTAKIAVGRRLDEIANAVTRRTTAAFEPSLDYLVVKIPRWPFDKFPDGDRRLGTQMRSTGEVMAIDRSFEGALQKAVRSLEFGGHDLFWEDPRWDDAARRRLVAEANDVRLWALMASLRRGAAPEALAAASGIDRFFIDKLDRIAGMERSLIAATRRDRALVRDAKRLGFSDRQIGLLSGDDAETVREQRQAWGLRPTYKMVDTCAAEFAAVTPYFYGTYEDENEAPPLEGPRALVLGSGPIRIGQGIEFDYCSVRASEALRASGVSSVMVNSNPETVSTDFDASTRLYFEPLDEESVRDVIDNETPDGTASPGALTQFGGQTAIGLAAPLARAGHPLLGSSLDAIDIAEDRDRFADLIARLGIPQPPGAIVTSLDQAAREAERLGYPVVVRPSYVLGGRAMEISHDERELRAFATIARVASAGRPLLVDKYLGGTEIEVDAISDGQAVLIPGIMQHVERAGVHSGDSIALYPAPDLSPEQVETIVRHTTAIGRGFELRGLFNIQFVLFGGEVLVLEVNPRASRTVPFLSKVTGIPMVDVAIRIALGGSLSDLPYGAGLVPAPRGFFAAKAPVFSMAKLIGVETRLGPEMRSTGEVMGLGKTVDEAIAKALRGAGLVLPRDGRRTALVRLDIWDEPDLEDLLADLVATGFTVLALDPRDTGDAVAAVRDGRVDFVVSTARGADGLALRRAAVERRVASVTSTDTARALLRSQRGALISRVLTVDEHRHGAGAGREHDGSAIAAG